MRFNRRLALHRTSIEPIEPTTQGNRCHFAAISSKSEHVMAIPDNLKTRLTRGATAQALTEAGFPTTKATLATKASRGGGPPFQKYGPRVLYEWGSSLAWAEAKLGPLVSSTAELDIVVREAAPVRSTSKADDVADPPVSREEIDITRPLGRARRRCRAAPRNVPSLAAEAAATASVTG